MKHILTLLALVFTAATLHAADPIVIVKSATSVTVDGVDFGKPADAIANNKKLASAIQIALEKWAAEKDAAHAAALAGAASDKATAEAKVADIQPKVEAVAAASDAASRRAALDALKSHLKADEKARRIAEIQKRIDAANKELVEANK